MEKDKETWLPIAAGMTNGAMLVVAEDGHLHIVSKVAIDKAGYIITSIPFEVLRKCGLNVSEKSNLLAEVVDIQRKLVDI